MEQTIPGGNLTPVLVAKPWGYERIIGVCSQVAAKEVHLSLNPGEAISRQLHSWKWEVYFVLSGGGRLELGRKDGAVCKWSKDDGVLLRSGTNRRVLTDEELPSCTSDSALG